MYAALPTFLISNRVPRGFTRDPSTHRWGSEGEWSRGPLAVRRRCPQTESQLTPGLVLRQQPRTVHTQAHSRELAMDSTGKCLARTSLARRGGMCEIEDRCLSASCRSHIGLCSRHPLSHIHRIHPLHRTWRSQSSSLRSNTRGGWVRPIYNRIS